MRPCGRTGLALTIAGSLLLAGCGRSDQRPHDARPANPTFTRDIAPILFTHCAACHRTGQLAPFSLLTYGDATMHADLIVDATSSRRMPPWLPEHGYGAFLNARRLTDAQIATIADWVRNGAPEGSASDLLATPSWHEGWQLGAPDLVASLPEPYTLQPTDTDVFRNFVIPVDVPASRFVRGVEFLPGSVHAVHHAVVGVDPTRMSRRMDAADPEPGYEGMFSEEFHSPDGHFVGWTPGRTGFLNPPDMSWRLERGTDLVVQVHMMPSRMPQRIDPRIGLFFTPTPPGRVPFMLKLTSTTIDIPPGEANYVVEDSYTLPVDVDALSVYPHAHYLARDLRAVATLPDGSTRWLIWIRNWDFDWQDFYRYVAPVPLPRGTRIAMTFTYDNSGNTPRHHGRAPARVVYGPRSTDEMGDLWLQVLPRQPEDLDVLARDYIRRSIEAGIAAAEKMVRVRPDDASRHNFLGTRYLAGGRTAEAIAQLREAVRLDPSYMEARNNIGAALLAAGKPGEALPHLRLAARSKPGDDRVHFNLGNALKADGNTEEAIRAFTRSLAINPDAADVHNNLAVAFGARREYQRAVYHLNRALVIREGYPEAHNNLAIAMGALGRFDEALRHATRALELQPDYADARDNLRLLRDAQQPRAPRIR